MIFVNDKIKKIDYNFVHRKNDATVTLGCYMLRHFGDTFGENVATA